VAKAVGAGVGLAGCHGGMCDAFRNDTEWQFMTGGQWVSHPGGGDVEYTVNITSNTNPITEGIADFPVKSEHYYLHVDPSIEVLATTRFPLVSYYHISNKPVDMPVVWTKKWGNGRVFYTSLGHHDDVFEKSPPAQTIMKRGMLWAADGKAYAREHGLTTERFENSAKMY
jgi:type 1 glutamine amidotransferase